MASYASIPGLAAPARIREPKATPMELRPFGAPGMDGRNQPSGVRTGLPRIRFVALVGSRDQGGAPWQIQAVMRSICAAEYGMAPLGMRVPMHMSTPSILSSR
jgi:hypothetical protein